MNEKTDRAVQNSQHNKYINKKENKKAKVSINLYIL